MLRAVSASAGSGNLSNVAYKAFKTGIPMIFISGGTMGNNGALSALTTALGRTIAKAYALFPSGSIAAGVPAAATWYYVEMSSGSAGTVYNNTFDPTQNLPPTIPSSKTAFSTTGPGAFTGVTGEMTALQYTIAANALGINGKAEAWVSMTCNSSATAKPVKVKLGGTQIGTVDGANNTAGWIRASATGQGATGSQKAECQGVSGNTNSNTAPSDVALDYTTALALIVTGNKGTSSDNIVIETCDFVLAQ